MIEVSKEDYDEYVAFKKKKALMIERRTEDKNTASGSDHAFEIMWQWLNAEVSIPYPSRRLVADIPITAKIWTHECNCQKECDKIKARRLVPEYPFKLIIPF